MAAWLDNCAFTPSAGGTTDWTYSSTPQGYQSPSAAGVVNSRTYKYHAFSADRSQWEIGEGAYNTGTDVLARTTVLYNSSGTTSKINFTVAPTVAIVALKGDLLSIEEANSFTSGQKTQARSNLGLVIGTDVQAYDAELAAIAGLTSAADRLPYFTGSATAALATLTSFARTLLDDADAATARGTLAAFGTGDALGSSQVATQSNQESASSTTLAVTPGRQQYHPSAAKAWLLCTMSGGTPGLTVNYNVSSITDNGVGDFTINFTTAFSTANYSVSGITRRLSSDGNDGACLAVARGTSPTTTACRIATIATSASALDVQQFFLQFFGDQ